ncbi:MAG: YciI family protein [Sneathiella sp.]
MQYSILIYSTEDAFERLSEDKQAEIMSEHHTLQAALKERGPFATAKLMPTSNAVTLKPAPEKGQKPLVVDGPFAETKERFLGLYVAEFGSLEEAIEFASIISSPIVSLEIRPIAWAGGLFSDDA